MTKLQAIAVAILATLTFSCHSPRYIYAPSTPNNPYFREKGESKLAAYYSGGTGWSVTNDGTNRGFDLQGAYAIDDHWAVTADYFHRKEKDIYESYRANFFDSSIVNYKRNITSLGGGYYTAIDKRQSMFVNIYGGIGFGKFSMQDDGLDKNGINYNRFHTSSITKWYIQPSYYFMPTPYFRSSIVAKFSFVNYGKRSTSYQIDEMEYFHLDRLVNKTLFFFEPTFNISLGIPQWDWLKIECAVTATTNPYAESNGALVRGLNGSVGLSFDISKMRKK